MKEEERNVQSDTAGAQVPREPLFDDDFLGKVSRLKLAIAKKSISSYQGRRRSAMKGSSAEFSDFREYIPGDDIRRIDWNVYARLDKPYVREYMEEREAAVNIFLDLSGSMAFWGKDRLAMQLAGAMTVMSLSAQDRVCLHLMEGGKLTTVRLSGTKQSGRRALDLISKAEAAGRGEIWSAIRSVEYLPSGMSFLISDFMDEGFLDHAEEVLGYLSYRRQEVVLLQVMAKEELKIESSGSFCFEDAEEAFDPVSISLDDKTIKAYETECEAFCRQVKRAAAERSAKYFLCSTEDGFEKIIYENLRSIYQ